MHRGAVALALSAALACPDAIGAQVDPSISLGAGTTRYAGGAAFSSVAVSPTVQVTTASVFTSAFFTVASLPQSDWAGQFRVDGWATAPTGGTLRPALALTGAGTVQTGGPGTGLFQLLAEAVWAAGDGGMAVGAGPSVGGVAGDVALTGLRARARGWWDSPLGLASAVVESHATAEGGFTDAQAGISAVRSTFTANGWLTARFARGAVRMGAGAALEVSLTRRVTLEASGGRALADPWQGFPAVAFGAVALRLHAAPRLPVAPRLPSRPAGPRVERHGDSVIVRFRMPGAAAVAIAGEWSSWTPEPLRALSDGSWEARLALAPGTYRFNLVRDGVTWVVPDGVGTLDDGMGGRVGLLVIP